MNLRHWHTHPSVTLQAVDRRGLDTPRIDLARRLMLAAASAVLWAGTLSATAVEADFKLCLLETSSHAMLGSCTLSDVSYTLDRAQALRFASAQTSTSLSHSAALRRTRNAAKAWTLKDGQPALPQTDGSFLSIAIHEPSGTWVAVEGLFIQTQPAHVLTDVLKGHQLKAQWHNIRAGAAFIDGWISERTLHALKNDSRLNQLELLIPRQDLLKPL